VFTGLIDHGCRQQFRWIEIADRKSFKPRLLSARHAMKLRAAHVPELDIDTVGAALAEQELSHSRSLPRRQTKDETKVFLRPNMHRKPAVVVLDGIP
jgi:hypothetical protein